MDPTYPKTVRRLLEFSLIFLAAPWLWAFSNDPFADLVLGYKTFTQRQLDVSDALGDTLNNPLQIYSDGIHLFIADGGNNRVLIYNSIPSSLNVPADVVLGQCDTNTGQGAEEGTSTPSATSLNDPFGVYYDGTKLYVADTGNNRVLIYNSLPITNNTTPSTEMPTLDSYI